MSECSDMMRNCVAHMKQVIKSDSELKSWFLSWEPDKQTGYMYARDPNLERLSALVDSDGHSGASFAVCCRIAKQELES